MDKTAIIAEYNPFHNGHIEQIRYIRERCSDTAVIAVMSGNIVQRGELAVFDKYDRASIAVRCGVDAVLELPYPWCASSAGYFAQAGVQIATALGVNRLCFGSESGDIDVLAECAARLGTPEFVKTFEYRISESMNSGESYISVCRSVYREMYGEDIPDGANNTLAIEYLLAITKEASPLVPMTHKRVLDYTATASRRHLRQGAAVLCDDVPGAMYDYCLTHKPTDDRLLSSLVLWHFRGACADTLRGFADVGDGMAQRMIACAAAASSLEEFLARCATKKYTNSRLRRAMLNCILQTEESRLKRRVHFTTLLAANERGCAAVKEMKKQGTLSIITKPADYITYPDEVARDFEFSLGADRLFATARGEDTVSLLKKSPVILNLVDNDSKV